jgi:hippurate hydrolase
MNMIETSSSDPALARLPGLLPELEVLYTDVHAHSDLSMQETRTAGLAAERLHAARVTSSGCQYQGRSSAMRRAG